jgi:UDP-GlcNAc:undecaprenyl-phosphate GlcNAc-1-phosphate transferase
LETATPFFAIGLIGFLVSMVISVLIIITLPWHKSFSSDSQHKVQGIHDKVIPRVGGIAIIAGLLISLLWNKDLKNSLVWVLFLSSLPVFFAGFLEDVGIGLSPLMRVFAAVLSAFTAIFVTNIWLSRIGAPMFDQAMAWMPFGVFCTVLAVATMSHAYNLSDGLNGLSSGLGVISVLGIFKLSQHAGDVELMFASLIFATSISGFWLLNFLSGRIFLGDGGAYLIGYFVAWFSIFLSVRHPELSPWAILLNTLLPIIDTIMAILRRAGRKLRLDEPDRCHFHHRVYNLVGYCAGNKVSLLFKNSVASSIVLLIAGFLSFVAVSHAMSNFLSALICLAVSITVMLASRHLGKQFD